MMLTDEQRKYFLEYEAEIMQSLRGLFSKLLGVDEYYFMIGEEEEGFFIVRREFWEQYKYIDDHELEDKIYDIIPKFNKGNGFRQVSESLFRYYVNGEEDFSKGLEYLRSLGFTELEPNF